LAGLGEPIMDVVGGWVLFDGIEDPHVQAGVAQDRQGPLRVAGFFQAGIGDQQDPRTAEFAGQFAEARQGAGAEHDPRERLEIERRQRPRRPYKMMHTANGGRGNGLHTPAFGSLIPVCSPRAPRVDYNAVVCPWNARARNRKSTIFPSCGCNQFNWIVGTGPMFKRSMWVASISAR